MGEATSAISAYPEVRQRLVGLQREAAERFGAVLEGRDIGTRVFPDTPYKFFLDARSDVRFRAATTSCPPPAATCTFDQVVDEISRRDLRDSTRTDSPLTRDGSYTFIDSSELTIDDVVDRMAGAIEGRGA